MSVNICSQITNDGCTEIMVDYYGPARLSNVMPGGVHHYCLAGAAAQRAHDTTIIVSSKQDNKKARLNFTGKKEIREELLYCRFGCIALLLKQEMQPEGP